VQWVSVVTACVRVRVRVCVCVCVNVQWRLRRTWRPRCRWLHPSHVTTVSVIQTRVTITAAVTSAPVQQPASPVSVHEDSGDRSASKVSSLARPSVTYLLQPSYIAISWPLKLNQKQKISIDWGKIYCQYTRQKIGQFGQAFPSQSFTGKTKSITNKAITAR